ncbi:MAG: flagellar filament capping protein FliD [Selenomonadaceae bacterium]|nr:flagellar filament capping protein FliD [Selenomonadaceae bacterium]
MGVNGIYGLSGSGLDIESMVKVGMMSRQSQYDKMQQQYTKNEWTKTAYVELYGKVQTFNNSTLSQYKMSANMNARTAESSNSSIKVTANGSAAAMSHYVKVTNSATNAYLIGENSVTRKGDSQTSTQLKDALFKSVNGSGNVVYYTDDNGRDHTVAANEVAFKFTVGNGEKGSANIVNSNSSAVTATAGDDAEDGIYSVSVNQLASAAKMNGSTSSMTRYDTDSTSTALKDLLFQSLGVNANNEVSYKNSSGQSNVGTTQLTGDDTAVGFTIFDGTSSAEIKFTYADIVSGATVEDLASKINDAELNIKASFDSDTQVFSLVNKDTGSSSAISISVTSDDVDSGNYAGNTTAALFNGLGISNLTAEGTNAIFSVNGESVTQDTNSYTTGGVTFDLTGTDDSEIRVDNYKVDETNNTISVTYGQLADGYTFNDLTAAVNSLGLTVKATYDSVNDKFSFYNTDSGSKSGVALKMGNDATAEFFNSLGLKQSENGELADNALTFATGSTSGVNGTNANVNVDGMNYDISDNKLTVNGVTYNFTGVEAGTTSTVVVNQDTDAIIDKVKSFVEDYNTLLKSLTDAYNEKPNSNYKPLTEAQREQMKDEQIEKWEEKAKAGMLYHDQTLGKLIDQMREAVTTPIEGISGKYNSIFAIGISTTGTKGQLTLDEDKLKAALNDDPDSVYNVFAKLDTNDMDNASKSGIAQRLGDVFMNNMKSIRSRSGTDLTTNDDSELSRLMRELQTKMSNFKSMMAAFEDKLYKKYDAMETALAGLGVQLNYVTSAFA